MAMAMERESQRLFVGLDAGTFQPKAPPHLTGVCRVCYEKLLGSCGGGMGDDRSTFSQARDRGEKEGLEQTCQFLQ